MSENQLRTARPAFQDLLVAIAKDRVLVLGLPLIVAVIALGVSFLLPTWYAANAKLLPPHQNNTSALALLGQLNPFANSAIQAFGLKNPSDIYVAILKSRTVADRVIERFKLQELYSEKLLSDARKELARNTRIIAHKDGTISITVEDKDPQRAADMANAYVEELKNVSSQLAITEAGQRRLFFEQRLQEAKADLLKAETALQKYAAESGVLSPQSQIGLSISTAAAIRAQITAKEVQLASMKAFATENNPEFARTMQELSGLRSQLAKMEANATAGKGDVVLPLSRAAEDSLTHLRYFRDVKYYEALVEALAKQYEIARVDEARQAALIQVLDSAVKPDRKSKPQRLVIVIVAFFVSTLVAIGLAALRNRKSAHAASDLGVLS